MNVANALSAEFSLEEQESIEEVPTVSPAAYALYLKARALVPDLSGGAARSEFLDPLNQAVTLDPEFALARATLAFVYAAASGRRETGSAEAEEMETLARDHAQRALAVDPSQGLAYAALAVIDENYGRVPEAQINWEKALESSPSDTDVLDDAVRFYSFTGQLDKARPLAARAYSLNPAQLTTQIWLHLGSKDFDAYVATSHQAIQEDPTRAGNSGARIAIGLGEALRNNSQAALEELQLAEELDPDFQNNYSFSRAIYAYGRIGRTDDAQRLFERFQDLANDETFAVSPAYLVRANLAIGDQEEALRWLNISAETPGRRSSLLYGPIIWNLYSDPILDQPEFVEVRSRLGFRE
jgi:tetratricopeptide (TPR) repeat protein